MVDSAANGSIRALYILGEDLALTEPDLGHTRRALAAAEFVVLQEIFPSATSEFADTERRVQPVRKAIPPAGEALDDWQITAGLARDVLAATGRQCRGPLAGWNYASPAQVLDEIAQLTPSYRGVGHHRLQRGERLQWPVWDEHHAGTPILHVDRFPRGKGKFHVTDHVPLAEAPDSEFPLLLTTGRVLYHWHGGELSRRSQPLTELCPDPMVEVNPLDAQRFGLSDGSRLRVLSRRGQMKARLQMTERVAEGIVFGNFHFPAEHNINSVTNRALDPVAKIPEYKACAVRIEPLASSS